MKKTAAEILREITVVTTIDGKTTVGNALENSRHWAYRMMEDAAVYFGESEEDAFTPAARNHFAEYLNMLMDAGKLPTVVYERRTDFVQDGCFVFDSVEDFAGPDTAPAPAKKAGKKAGKTFMEKAMDAFRAAKARFDAGEELHVYFSENNHKTGMPTLDLLPLLTCHGRCREMCGKIPDGKALPPCYAANMCNRFPYIMQRYAENTVLAIYAPAQYWAEVRERMQTAPEMRLFGSGDAVIKGYFRNLCDALRAVPGCEMQGFTKCWETAAAEIDRSGNLPANLHLLLSGWDGVKPYNPHNLPETDVYEKGTELPSGWRACCGNCQECRREKKGCWAAGAGDIVGFEFHGAGGKLHK